MRKLSVLTLVVLVLSALVPLRAQDQPPSPQQGQGVPIVTGSDLYRRAQTALQAGNFEKAIVDSSLFILLNPTFGQAYYLRSLGYAQLGDFDHALADLSNALAFPSPDVELTAEMYRLRANIYLQQENFEAALADLDAGIQAAPEYAASYLDRARVYISQQKIDEALADYDKTIELDPQNADAYADRALVNQQLGKLDEALADYDRLLEISPDDALAYRNRSSIHIEQSNLPAALDDLNNAIRISPQASGLYLARGFVNNLLNNPANAAADYLEWAQRSETRRVDQADMLTPGESLVLQMQQGLVYHIPFEAKGGQIVNLSATVRQGSTVDPLLVLLDPTGSPIAADDDGGGDYNAAIRQVILSISGTYTLVLTHAGGGWDGPVRVLLQVQ